MSDQDVLSANKAEPDEERNIQNLDRFDSINNEQPSGALGFKDTKDISANKNNTSITTNGQSDSRGANPSCDRY